MDLVAVGTADLVLFVGTSLSVGVTDLVLRSALASAAVISIDPAAPRADLPADSGIEALAARAGKKGGTYLPSPATPTSSPTSRPERPERYG